MFVSLQLRRRLIFRNIASLLQAMAFDPRLYPSTHVVSPSDASSRLHIPSSASTPSLRSRESVVSPFPRTMSDTANPGGNVKVVVRVRSFLPRGSVETVPADSTMPDTVLIQS